MIVEQRTYDIACGQVPLYLRMYEAEGFAVQRRHLGTLLGYYSSEFGVLNQIIHLWAYNDLKDRTERRAALFADDLWIAYFQRIIPIVVRQHSTILTPARFLEPVEGRISIHV